MKTRQITIEGNCADSFQWDHNDSKTSDCERTVALAQLKTECMKKNQCDALNICIGQSTQKIKSTQTHHSPPLLELFVFRAFNL